MSKKVLIIVNEDVFFLSHRVPIAMAARERGMNVTVVAKNTGKKQEIEALGFRFVELLVNPTGMNPLQEMKTFFWLTRLFCHEHPDVVHLVGLKVMLWGGLAAKLMRVPMVVNAVSGLGILFSSEHIGLVARCMLWIQRFSNHRKNVAVIFQNNDDKSIYLKYRVVTIEQCRFAKGSGVNLTDFAYTPELPSKKIHVIFSARMVREKGVYEVIEAAEMLRKEYVDRVEFWLCGGLHANPKALQADELNAMCDGQYIQWLGFCSDIKERLQASHIVAFPSYYREGVPKSLIDACAIGRPIITCDSVGCRDVVTNGENGFLIPPRDAKALADKLRILIEDAALRQRMGKTSREKAEREFDINKVVQVHLDAYCAADERKRL